MNRGRQRFGEEAFLCDGGPPLGLRAISISGKRYVPFLRRSGLVAMQRRLGFHDGPNVNSRRGGPASSRLQRKSTFRAKVDVHSYGGANASEEQLPPA